MFRNIKKEVSRRWMLIKDQAIYTTRFICNCANKEVEVVLSEKNGSKNADELFYLLLTSKEQDLVKFYMRSVIKKKATIKINKQEVKSLADFMVAVN